MTAPLASKCPRCTGELRFNDAGELTGCAKGCSLFLIRESLNGASPPSLTPSQNGSQNSASQRGFSARVRLGTRNEELGLAKKGVSKPLVPSLKETSKAEDEKAEVEELLKLYEAKELEPFHVDLPPLPDDATDTMRKVAGFYRVVLGLRLGEDMRSKDGEWGPADVPFACGWVGKKIGRPKPSVHRALRQLEAAGVLRRVGSLPGRPDRRGTHVWAPGRKR
jgi:hypothetical protein